MAMPSSRLPARILTASAIALGAFGVLLLFAPEEAAGALGWGSGTTGPSLAAAGLLSVAVLDWMGRGAIYGGIYGRPIVLANLTLAITGGLTLVRAQAEGGGAPPLGWLPVAVLGLHGVGFAFLLFGSGIGGDGG